MQRRKEKRRGKHFFPVIVNWFSSTPPSYSFFFFLAALIYNNTSVVRCLRSAKLGRLRSRGGQGMGGAGGRARCSPEASCKATDSWMLWRKLRRRRRRRRGQMRRWRKVARLIPFWGVHELIMTQRKPSPPPQMPAEVPLSHAAPKRCARVLILPAFCDFSLGPLRTKKPRKVKRQKNK